MKICHHCKHAGITPLSYPVAQHLCNKPFHYTPGQTQDENLPLPSAIMQVSQQGLSNHRLQLCFIHCLGALCLHETSLQVHRSCVMTGSTGWLCWQELLNYELMYFYKNDKNFHHMIKKRWFQPQNLLEASPRDALVGGSQWRKVSKLQLSSL